MRTKPVLVLATVLLVGGVFLSGTLARPDVFAAGPAALQANTPPPEVSPFRIGGKPPSPVLNIAHRGARAFAPENTLQSFKKAIELGCHMIELDVHHSKDRQLIVVHDDDLVRCSDVKKRFPGRKTYFVSDFTADEIRTLDAGSWFVEALNGPRNTRDGYLRDLTDEEERRFIAKAARASYASGKVRIPTLSEVLKWAKENKVFVNIELKTIPRRYPGLTADVVRLVEELKMEREVILSSFDHDALVEVRRLTKVIATAALVSDRLHEPGRYVREFLDADSYNPGCYGDYDVLGFYSVSGKLTPEPIKSAREAGLSATVWTENDPERMKQLIGAGATGIITDYPNRLLNVLAEMDKPKM